MPIQTSRGLCRFHAEAVRITGHKQVTEGCNPERIEAEITGTTFEVQRFVGVLSPFAGPGWFVPAMVQEWVSFDQLLVVMIAQLRHVVPHSCSGAHSASTTLTLKPQTVVKPVLSLLFASFNPIAGGSISDYKLLQEKRLS
eukprot:SAG31_NODE_16981_length_688_cov_0.514431_2_plen_141_part_00